MSTALENLNLEEGKSDALRVALAGIAESTSIDGGPRYSEKTCRELARIIVCRSYAKPLLELSYLLACASARDGHYENLFWGVPRASAVDFRHAFADWQSARPDIVVGTKSVAFGTGDDRFQVTFSRMPLLAALLEFLIMSVGYPAVDDMTAPLRERGADGECVLDAARAMQRSLYAYLKDHLPAVQRQRRERHFLEYVDGHAGNRAGADAINDDVVLEYWKANAASAEIETRTYRAVYDTARRLVGALDAANDRLAAERAKSIGTDFDAGEVDPADVDAVAAMLDDGENPLQRVLDTCRDQVKFVNLGESEALGELPLGDAAARRIPVSVLRNAVFGAAQLRMSAALRRGDGVPDDLPRAEDEYYRDRLCVYAGVIDATEKHALAALWALFQAERPEAVELALAIAPDIDWGVLARGDDGSDDRIVSLAAVGASRQFFRHVPDARGDEISALLADAKRTWRAVNRAGFHDDDDEETLDVMAAAVPDVLNLIQAVRRTLDRDLAAVDWPAFEASDAGDFASMFRTLYDVDEEADSHAR